ncbi:MAG: SCPU domain-containing protein, partial [Acinetobacter calcoaceticus]
MSITTASYSFWMKGKKLSLTIKYILAIVLFFILYAFFSSAHAACTVTGT